MLTVSRKYFPPTAEDVPQPEPTEEADAAANPSTSSMPLDTQDSSLIAAAEKSANNEEPESKKLKVTNPDVESDDWEQVEKPEDFLEIESAAEKDMAQSEAAASKSAGEAVPETIAEIPTAEEKETSADGSLGKNSLLKDW